MEVEVVNGVEVEASNGELNSSVNKENELVENSGDAVQVNNDVSEDSLLTAEGLDSPQVGSEDATTVAPVSKDLNVAKKSGSSKAQKEGAGRNGMAKVMKNTRAGLSQSLSFPARGTLASAIKKSTAVGKQAKGDAKTPQSNGSEVSNGRTSDRVTAAARKSLPAKLGSMDHTTASETIKFSNGDMKPLKQTRPAKIDDDANSTTSSTTPRSAHRKSTGFGFSFRLDERAEKRKEFFMKLEEKIHAKEVEKTNLQAQSKESQEAEIKQLRKSLTFKATPMPTFYQEPVPPKVELKKIPPTRARSPKLGRHKPSTTDANNSSEGTTPASTDPIKSNGGATDSNDGSIKKATQKTLSRTPSQKSTAAKPEVKPVSLKPKVTTSQKQKADKPKAGGNKKPEKSESIPETLVETQADSAENTIKHNEITANSADSGAVLSEIVEVPNELHEIPMEASKVSVED